MSEVEDQGVDGFDMDEFMQIIEGAAPYTVYLSERYPSVEIKTVRAAQLFNITDLLRGVLSVVGSEVLTSDKALQTFAKKFMENPDVIFDLVQDNEERLFRVLAGMSNLSEEQVMDLEVDEVAILTMCEWRLNERFFMTRVKTRLSQLMPQQSTEQLSKGPKPKGGQGRKASKK